MAGNNNNWTLLETIFHEHVAPRFTGLEYNPGLEQNDCQLNETKTVYYDDRTKIKAFKWMGSYSEYDVATSEYNQNTSYTFYVDGVEVYKCVR